MTFPNTSLIHKLILFLAGVMLSVSAMAADFNQTQRLANQGNADAQFRLGMMYHRGEGVRQDYAKAFEWNQKSADQGNALAQFRLAGMYYKGEGVRQNMDTAKELNGKACDNGYQPGCDGYRLLSQILNQR